MKKACIPLSPKRYSSGSVADMEKYEAKSFSHKGEVFRLLLHSVKWFSSKVEGVF